MDAPIRLATPADLGALLALMQAFYDESDYPLDGAQARAAFEHLLADEGHGRVWIAERDGEAVGYAVLTLGFAMEYYGRDGFLDDLYLAPAARGQGLGTKLVDAVEREARALGVRALRLEVGRDDHRAKALYAARGFRDDDRQLLTKRL